MERFLRTQPFVLSLSKNGGRCGSTRSPRTAIRLALACACGLLIAGADAIAAGKSVRHTVMIEGTKYEPETVTVKRGETVVWVNKDPFPHTVTAKGLFDSHDIAAGKSWRYTARKAGEYAYTCTLHPNMKGTLKVE
jgi:plastocyanin